MSHRCAFRVGVVAKIWAMATRERIHELIDSLPDTPEAERMLAAAEDILDSSHISDPAVEDDAMLVGHEAAMDRLRADPEQWAAWQAEIAELDGTLGDGLAAL